MRDIFNGCNEFFQDLSEWNLPKYKQKAHTIYVDDMFHDCPIRNKEEYLPNIRFKK